MKNKFIFISIVLIIGILVYSTNNEYRYESNIESNKMIAYVNGKRTGDIPGKNDGYIVDKIECTNNATGTWDNESWGILITDLADSDTKCSVYFIDNDNIDLSNLNASNSSVRYGNSYGTNGSYSYNPLYLTSTTNSYGMGAVYGVVTNDYYDLSNYNYIHIVGDFYGLFNVTLETETGFTGSSDRILINGDTCLTYNNTHIDEYYSIENYNGSYKLSFNTHGCVTGNYATATFNKIELTKTRP